MTSRIGKIDTPSTRATPAENPSQPGTDEQSGITTLWCQAANSQLAGSQFSKIREFLKKENKLGRT